MKSKSVFLHLISIAIFVFLESKFVFPALSGSGYIIAASFYTLNIAFFYLMLFGLFPRIIPNFKILPILLGVSIALIVYGLASFYLSSLVLFYIKSRPFPDLTWDNFSYSLYRGGIVSGVAALIFYLSYSHKQEKDKLYYQLLQQRAVMTSHLTNNVLNFIYNDTLEKAPDSAKAIELLSEHLQQSMQTPAPDGLITLLEEAENIVRFITTMELTAPRKRHLTFTTDMRTADPEGIRVPPNILVSIVDNMYRHGDLTDPLQPGLVNLKVMDNNLSFECKNRKLPFLKPGYGIGMGDTRFLLKHVFGKRWSLNITDEKKTFNLKLEIWMKN